MFEKDMRVRVIGTEQAGTVVYVRMVGPAFVDIAAVSVRLDAKASDPRYAGSLYFPRELEPVLV